MHALLLSKKKGEHHVDMNRANTAVLNNNIVSHIVALVFPFLKCRSLIAAIGTHMLFR